MSRFDPIGRHIPRGRGGHHTRHAYRGIQRRRGSQRERVSNGYTWNNFHREDHNQDHLMLPNMSVPPPKPIPTIQFDADPEEASSSTANPDSFPRNICARWLAKNPQFRKTKTAEVVLDDSEIRDPCLDDSDDIIVIEPESSQKSSRNKEHFKEENKAARGDALQEIIELSEDDESVVEILEEEPAQRMVKVETVTKMKHQQLWSQPTSSSQGTALLQKLNDCFSRDCDAYQRVPRSWAQPRHVQRALQNPNIPTSTFTVCSYNVLCQKTIDRTNYLYKHLRQSEQYLDWQYRWNGLKSELPTFNADILGLQEVQADHFEQDFGPFMKTHGYEGVYKRKFGTEQKDDGCAIFYRPDKFDKIGYQEVNYFVSPEATSNRENIGQILVLRCRATDEILIVGNTHLLFNQERGDVKLAQLAILFAFIHKLSNEMESYKPLVMVMGDFNIEPNSKVYDFIVQGMLHIDGEFARTLSGQSGRPGGKVCYAAQLLSTTNIGTNSMFRPMDVASEVSDGKLTHPFKFFSAYHIGLSNRIPYHKRTVSTFHKDSAAPDFIFFTPDFKNGTERLRLLETFALPTFDSLLRATPWPNQHVPSDHLPLMAKFRLTKQ